MHFDFNCVTIPVHRVKLHKLQLRFLYNKTMPSLLPFKYWYRYTKSYKKTWCCFFEQTSN